MVKQGAVPGQNWGVGGHDHEGAGLSLGRIGILVPWVKSRPSGGGARVGEWAERDRPGAEP